MQLVKLAVFISGTGSNLQALLQSEVKPHIGCVISNRQTALGLNIAEKQGVPAYFVERDGYDQAVLKILDKHQIDGIVLAGYLKILPDSLINRYQNKIINIHPSLLPSFGGKGYYGIKVHEAVLRKGCKVTGATVHMVTSEVDGGQIMDQLWCPVLATDTAMSLQQRVLELEHQLIVSCTKTLIFKIGGKQA